MPVVFFQAHTVAGGEVVTVSLDKVRDTIRQGIEAADQAKTAIVGVRDRAHAARALAEATVHGSQHDATDFTTDARFDNPRAVQVRLPGFTQDGLRELGARVRDLFVAGTPDSDRIGATVDDDYLASLAQAVTGQLGGKVGVAPRVFLKKLVADVLDRVELHRDFDPRRHYHLTLSTGELTEVERNAAGLAIRSVDDIELELP